jgi:transposase-like protein
MKKHTPDEIVLKLRRVDALAAQGKTTAEAARDIGVTEAKYYRWRRRYGGMDRDEARRLKELERENARPKKLVAELALDNDILKEVARGKF